jgi:hypothetical protein
MTSQAEYNLAVYRSKGLGGWRALYLQFVRRMGCDSIVEFGAGDTAFLERVSSATTRTAIDGTERYKALFEEKQIAFVAMDLNAAHEALEAKYDIAVCSDVFEHLLQPAICLGLIKESLKEDGVLFAHVPNEFVFVKTLQVMGGTSEAIYSHAHCSEWDHPHLHRFSDKGFLKFISRQFAHCIRITDLRYGRFLKLFSRMGLRIPYCLQGGPTYACTNSLTQGRKLAEIKDQLSRISAQTLACP